ncbi:MAG: hypothetical protein ACYDAC_09620 [Candidatus Dormibacteria bacterium]
MAHRWDRALGGLGVALVALAGLSSMGASPARAAASTQPISFGTPSIVDPVHTYGEPNVGINPKDGSVYDSGPEGTGVQRSGWEGSVDGGSTFRIVGQCPNATTFVTATQPCPIPGGPTAAGDQIAPTSAPGGGDAEQKFDSKGTQYFADLYALACQRVAYTSDDGATAPESALGCGQTHPTCGTSISSSSTPCPGEGTDRQWLAVLDPGLINQATIPHPAKAPDGTSYTGPFPVVYMEYNNLQTVQNGCSTWLMIGNPNNPTTSLNYAPANNTITGNFGCDGYPSIDQETGQVLEASTCAAGASTHGICLNIGTPDSTGFLHFLDDAGGPGLITIAQNLPQDAADLFVVSSIDSAQNLHVSYGLSSADDTSGGSKLGPSDWQIFTTVASAASGWTQWATPVQVSRAPSNINIFPWVAAGNGPECNTSAAAMVACAGRSDTTWYGNSDNAEGPSSTSPGKQVWDVYMAQVVWPVDATGAYTGGQPLSNTMVKVTPHPMQYGGICLLGTGCITAQGNRNVADFFEVAADSHGAAVVVYDDNSNNLLQEGEPGSLQASDHAGASVITLARQTGGPGLAGTDVPANPQYETSAPQPGMSQAAGSARYPVVGGAPVPAMDVVGNHLSLSADSSTLTVTMNVNDLSSSAISAAFSAVPGTTSLTYVTRWLEPSNATAGTCSLPASTACSLFYAMAEVTPAAVAGGAPAVTFHAGTAQSIDLCSVSACFPHVVYYPEAAPAGNVLSSGTFNSSTGQISIAVPATDVGNPSQTTLLEEVGSYALASDHPQQAETNAEAQADDVPFEIGGLCCFNYMAAPPVQAPEAPWTPALLLAGLLLAGTGMVLRRRSRSSAAVIAG